MCPVMAYSSVKWFGATPKLLDGVQREPLTLAAVTNQQYSCFLR